MTSPWSPSTNHKLDPEDPILLTQVNAPSTAKLFCATPYDMRSPASPGEGKKTYRPANTLRRDCVTNQSLLWDSLLTTLHVGACGLVLFGNCVILSWLLQMTTNMGLHRPGTLMYQGSKQAHST